MKKEYVYGKWFQFKGCWGVAEFSEDYETVTNFKPEWSFKEDLVYYWKARKPLIKVMGISGYTKELLKGIMLYRKLC